MLLLGPHTRKEEHPDEQWEKARDASWGAFQTFIGSNRSMNVQRTAKFAQNPGPGVWVAHSAYTVHAMPKEELRDATKRYLRNLAAELWQYKGSSVVLHTGGTKTKTVETIREEMHRFLAELHREMQTQSHSVRIAIENTAGAYDWNKDLRNLAELTKEFTPHIGWCIDYAHAWAAGVPWGNIKEALEINPPLVAHVNYPGSIYGSGLDRHGWYYQALNRTGRFPALNGNPQDHHHEEWEENFKKLAKMNIPLIVEGGSTDGSYEEEINALRNLVKETE